MCACTAAQPPCVPSCLPVHLLACPSACVSFTLPDCLHVCLPACLVLMQVLAASFPSLDADLDAREYSFPGGEKSANFRGFHRLERLLFRCD